MDLGGYKSFFLGLKEHISQNGFIFWEGMKNGFGLIHIL